jgi:hypothetical protein
MSLSILRRPLPSNKQMPNRANERRISQKSTVPSTSPSTREVAIDCFRFKPKAENKRKDKISEEIYNISLFEEFKEKFSIKIIHNSKGKNKNDIVNYIKMNNKTKIVTKIV